MELLLLPDGRILTHNLTPAMALVLHRLYPDDGRMKRRAFGARKRRANRSGPSPTARIPRKL